MSATPIHSCLRKVLHHSLMMSEEEIKQLEILTARIVPVTQFLEHVRQHFTVYQYNAAAIFVEKYFDKYTGVETVLSNPVVLLRFLRPEPSSLSGIELVFHYGEKEPSYFRLYDQPGVGIVRSIVSNL